MVSCTLTEVYKTFGGIFGGRRVVGRCRLNPQWLLVTGTDVGTRSPHQLKESSKWIK